MKEWINSPVVPGGNLMLFLLALGTQVIGTSLLPRTGGFTDILWTSICLASYIVSFFAISLLIKQGVALNVIVPLMAASVPLAAIIVGRLVYQEPLSTVKLILLLVACGVIGLASSVA